MPARIDPEKRRREVVEAAFRLVISHGVEGISLRKVAEESGLNIGSVRHYFDGHQDLLVAAAQEAGDRMGRRLAQHHVGKLEGLTGTAAVDALQALVEEVLPIGPERRDDATVVAEFIMASRTREVFRPMSEQMAKDLTVVLHDALQAAGAADPTMYAAQLSALIGGLTTDALTPHGSLDDDQVRDILRAQLTLMLGSP